MGRCPKVIENQTITLKGQSPKQQIIALFKVFIPYLSTTLGRQLSHIVFAQLAMTGRVTMLNISRWTSKGGSYRTGQRFSTRLCRGQHSSGCFFRTHLFDPESDYILVADETVTQKSGKRTYGLSRFFSSIHGKAIPSLSFLAVSIVSIKERRSYPMAIEQIVKDDTSSEPATFAPKQQGTTETTAKRPRGRPKGSKNRNKADVVLTGILKQLQTMLMSILPEIKDLIPLRYFVLDGYFGHNNALQMTKQAGLHLISKLRIDAALHLPPRTPDAGKGHPCIYGNCFDTRQIAPKYCVSVNIQENLRTEVSQTQLRHKKFTAP